MKAAGHWLVEQVMRWLVVVPFGVPVLVLAHCCVELGSGMCGYGMTVSGSSVSLVGESVFTATVILMAVESNIFYSL